MHFLSPLSPLIPGRVSLHLKSSSQNSANQMFLLLFSSDLVAKYWSNPEKQVKGIVHPRMKNMSSLRNHIVIFSCMAKAALQFFKNKLCSVGKKNGWIITKLSFLVELSFLGVSKNSKDFFFLHYCHLIEFFLPLSHSGCSVGV